MSGIHLPMGLECSNEHQPPRCFRGVQIRKGSLPRTPKRLSRTRTDIFRVGYSWSPLKTDFA
eukprot:scaffold207001_cov39-Prasinocladus_malaysianus.AAC.1